MRDCQTRVPDKNTMNCGKMQNSHLEELLSSWLSYSKRSGESSRGEEEQDPSVSPPSFSRSPFPLTR